MVCNRKKGIMLVDLAMRSEAEYKKKSEMMNRDQRSMPRNNIHPSLKAPLPAPSSVLHTGPTPREPPIPSPRTYQASGSRPQSRPSETFNFRKPPLSPTIARPMARHNTMSPSSSTPQPMVRHSSVITNPTTARLTGNHGTVSPTTSRPMARHSPVSPSPTTPRPMIRHSPVSPSPTIPMPMATHSPVSSSPTTVRTMAMQIPVSRSPTSPTPSIPSPSPANSRVKRKEPLFSNFEPSIDQEELPLPVTEPAFDIQNRPFFCKLCFVDCQSMVTYKMHTKGRQHKAKLKLLSSSKTEGLVGQHLPCDLCKIWCMNKDNLQQHYKGKNHILKLHAAQMQNNG